MRSGQSRIDELEEAATPLGILAIIFAVIGGAFMAFGVDSFTAAIQAHPGYCVFGFILWFATVVMNGRRKALLREARMERALGEQDL